MDLNRKIKICDVRSRGSSDWIKIQNTGKEEVDISGYFVSDDKGLGRIGKYKPLHKGTTLAADETYTFKRGEDFSFGLGKEDEARLYDSESELIDIIKWTNHADSYFAKFEITKNKDWPGLQEVKVVDDISWFYEDSSGLDFGDGSLFVVDNAHGIVWRLELDEHGVPSMPDQFTEGKKIIYRDKNRNPRTGLDIEGVSYSDDNKLFFALEVDNDDKTRNLNEIIMGDLSKFPEEEYLFIEKEWNLNNIVPISDSNYGIEAVEWAKAASLDGYLVDQNTNEIFDHRNYPEAQSEGLFFVAHEATGLIFVVVLNEDESVVLINSIDSGFDGAMGLDYDNDERVLWVSTDDSFLGQMARIKFKFKEDAKFEFYNPPKYMDSANLNNEGFALADKSYGPVGLRPAYWVHDGDNKKSLRMAYLSHADLYADNEE